MHQAIAYIALCLLLVASELAAARAEPAGNTSAERHGSVTSTTTAKERSAPAASPAKEEGDASEFGKVAIPGFSLFAPPSYWRRFKTGVPKLEVGRWARYHITDSSHDYGYLRFAVVREGDYKAVEVRHEPPTGDRSFVKTVLDGGLASLRNIVALQVKAPGLPPLTLPVGEKGAKLDPKTTREQEALAHAKVRYLGEKVITTEAGRFDTWHYRVETRGERKLVTELWLSKTEAVPLFRIVRSRVGDKTIELESVGEHALSELPPIDLSERPPPESAPTE